MPSRLYNGSRCSLIPSYEESIDVLIGKRSIVCLDHPMVKDVVVCIRVGELGFPGLALDMRHAERRRLSSDTIAKKPDYHVHDRPVL